MPVFICFEDDPEDEQLAKDDAKSLAEALAESGHIVGYALQAKGRLDVRTLADYNATTKSSLRTMLGKLPLLPRVQFTLILVLLVAVLALLVYRMAP